MLSTCEAQGTTPRLAGAMCLDIPFVVNSWRQTTAASNLEIELPQAEFSGNRYNHEIQKNKQLLRICETSGTVKTFGFHSSE